MTFDFERFWETLIYRSPPHAWQHLQLVLIPLAVAFLVAFPVAILLTRPRFSRYADRVMAVFSSGQTIPPLAVIAIFFPFLGLGRRPALFALTIYALLPIARNTLAAIKGISPEVKEAARGMGMSPWQVLTRVEIPLSVPVVMAGIKVSAVLISGTAALGALIGGGGMGAVLFAGINFFRVELILAGTLVIAGIAIAFDRMLSLLDYLLSPANLRIRS